MYRYAVFGKEGMVSVSIPDGSNEKAWIYFRKAIGVRKYDKENYIAMTLSPQELGLIVNGLKGNGDKADRNTGEKYVSIIHDPNATAETIGVSGGKRDETKHLYVRRGFIGVSHNKKGEDPLKIGVGVSLGDAEVLITLFKRGIKNLCKYVRDDTPDDLGI